MDRILMLVFLALLASTVQSAEPKAPAVQPVLILSREINDREIQTRLTTQAEQMLKDGRATATADLLEQMGRKHCNLRLPKRSKRKLSAAAAYEKCRAGVVVVAQPYLCTKCNRTHSQVASGFMLTSDGAFCTSYHVMSNRNAKTMIVLTGNGRIAPVREVLAANRDTDLIILRAEGAGFTPLPLSTNAAVGSIVRVISHPNSRFFSLTEGIASRYFRFMRYRKPVTMLAITADFAKGSSGAPVLDESGAVIASVNSTFSSYYDTDNEGHRENLQMVFKSCVSSRHILDLIEAD